MKTVYLHYDQAALDAEYDNRKKVSNSREWLARFADASARTRTDFENRLDVPFGTHAGERLDIRIQGSDAGIDNLLGHRHLPVHIRTLRHEPGDKVDTL